MFGASLIHRSPRGSHEPYRRTWSSMDRELIVCVEEGYRKGGTGRLPKVLTVAFLNFMS